MEIEARQGVAAKKLWKMVRVLFFMIAKTKTMVHLKLFLKRGKLAINTLMMNRQLYYSSFTCRSCDNGDSFISPLEFEFSCSNTPLHHSSRGFCKPRHLYTLPGLGRNPVGRELRVTGSPFPLKDEEDSYQVDMAAEEFINNFYKQLNTQNRSMATYESP